MKWICDCLFVCLFVCLFGYLEYVDSLIAMLLII